MIRFQTAAADRSPARPTHAAGSARLGTARNYPCDCDMAIVEHLSWCMGPVRPAGPPARRLRGAKNVTSCVMRVNGDKLCDTAAPRRAARKLSAQPSKCSAAPRIVNGTEPGRFETLCTGRTMIELCKE